jgi:hypothetical protein
MKSVYCCLSVCLALLGCGREASDVTGVARAEGDEEREIEVASAAHETTTASSSVDERLRELEELPRLDASESRRLAPNCDAPTSVGLSAAGAGTRAVRLLWDPETGDCGLDDVDRSPEGTLGILALRVKDGVAVLSSVGQWKYYASTDLDPSEVPLNEPFTIYPYLGDWQFAATLEYNGELVELIEFAYLRGKGPSQGGAREDVEDQAPSEFVPPTLCAPIPEEGETP